MTKELLKKFLQNTCTEEELNEIIVWIDSEAFYTESKNLGLDEWNKSKGEEVILDDYNSNLILDKIHQKIKVKKGNDIEGKKLRIQIVQWLTKAAAILFLPVLGILIYSISNTTSSISENLNFGVDSLEIIAPIGSRAKVQLSDGSEVILNYGSKIKYPQNFSGNTREVILSGEGYFNVAHNPDVPFIVKTKDLDIKALGTIFNVNAYPDEDFVATSLVEGKVVIEQKDINGDANTLGAIVPNQYFNYNISKGTATSSYGNIEKYIAWKEGKLVFENEPIISISEKLSRMFNVEIEITDETIKDYTYTVTFVDEPLFQILELMTIATPISYQTLPRVKLANGTFSKQKIIIDKK